VHLCGFRIFLSIWYSTFLFHWVLCSFVELHGPCGCLRTKMRSEWIGESWTESAGEFRCGNWRLSPTAEFHRSVWVSVLLCMGRICFLLKVLIFFWVAIASVRYILRRRYRGVRVIPSHRAWYLIYGSIFIAARRTSFRGETWETDSHRYWETSCSKVLNNTRVSQ
jgi:hypothetical protein